MATPEKQSTRQVLRSPWSILCWLLGLMIAVTGLATVLPDPEFGWDLETAAFGAVLMLLPGAWVVLRVPFMRVTLDHQQLRNHGLFRTRTLDWQGVQEVELEEVNGTMLGSAFAPVLKLSDGAEFPLMQLAGYTTARRAPRTRMARQAACIREHLPYRVETTN